MVVKTWCGHLVQLLDCFSFANPQCCSTHVFACPSMSQDHEVTFAPFFPFQVTLPVAPAEIRDSNMFLYSSTIPSFDLHSRWVHPGKWGDHVDCAEEEPICFTLSLGLGLEPCSPALSHTRENIACAKCARCGALFPPNGPGSQRRTRHQPQEETRPKTRTWGTSGNLYPEELFAKGCRVTMSPQMVQVPDGKQPF